MRKQRYDNLYVNITLCLQIKWILGMPNIDFNIIIKIVLTHLCSILFMIIIYVKYCNNMGTPGNKIRTNLVVLNYFCKYLYKSAVRHCFNMIN